MAFPTMISQPIPGGRLSSNEVQRNQDKLSAAAGRFGAVFSVQFPGTVNRLGTVGYEYFSYQEENRIWVRLYGSVADAKAVAKELGRTCRIVKVSGYLTSDGRLAVHSVLGFVQGE
jgi:hypothetical protein